MEIRQKRIGMVHTFTFGDTQLTYHYKDRSGEGEAEVAYSDLPEKHSVVIQSNEWLRNAGYLWCALGALQVAVALGTKGSMVGTGFWALLGLICLAIYHLRKVRYSVYKTSEGNIFVIQGKGHDDVVKELMQRRKAQLLQWYGEVNLENEPAREIAKFRWLEKQKVLTSEEAAAKIAEVQGEAGPQPNEESAVTN